MSIKYKVGDSFLLRMTIDSVDEDCGDYCMGKEADGAWLSEKAIDKLSAKAAACPACRNPEIGRVYLESEEAAMLAALGTLTFERDEARRWARHFYRLWKATQRTVASKGRKAKGAK